MKKCWECGHYHTSTSEFYVGEHKRESTKIPLCAQCAEYVRGNVPVELHPWEE